MSQQSSSSQGYQNFKSSMTREQLQEFEQKPCADQQFIYKYSKRFRTGHFLPVLKSSGTYVKSSMVWDEDSETKSKRQT